MARTAKNPLGTPSLPDAPAVGIACQDTTRCQATLGTPEQKKISETCQVALSGFCPLADQHVAIRDYIAVNKPAIGRMLRGAFEISTLGEAEKLATMLASHCPNPDMASIGIWELLANAIEHGNLEIDFALKSTLLMQGRHHSEIERRLQLPQYRHRVVSVVFQQSRKAIRLRITDEGPGFDFETALKAERPALAPNGRGLMLARTMTFTRIRFIGKGNIVDAVIDLGKAALLQKALREHQPPA
jgi:Histidine kinase-like ATPase domain